ncbi:HAAS signaling domain-containing protein [Lysinibacillus sp. NPDC097231]|uniref:HAAS signaling domain-containing protein n=1 Tax=Lysinibacillus sp. NPDC097231 TaxID=3364142 RepID=UPI0038194673
MKKVNLIDAYIHEVTRRINKNKRDDIALELKSTIEDMLSEDYSESDVKEVLKKLGNPEKVAASYQDTPRFLIGPQVFDTYIRTIKLVVPWAILITVIVQMVESVVLYSGEDALLTTIIKAISITITNIITVIIQVLFWITVAFIVIERSGGKNIRIPFVKDLQQWTPDDLTIVKIVPKEKTISLNDIIFSFLGIIIFTFVYFNANHLLGIYTSNNKSDLKFVMPIFNQDVLLSFAPIVLFCIVLSIALTLLKLKAGQWTMLIAVANALIQCIGTIVFILMVKQPDFIHSAAVPYIAAITETTSAKILFAIDRILLVSIFIAIIANVFDIYHGFKKAKIREDI